MISIGTCPDVLDRGGHGTASGAALPRQIRAGPQTDLTSPCCLLSAFCLLPTAYCPLPSAYCLLPTPSPALSRFLALPGGL